MKQFKFSVFLNIQHLSFVIVFLLFAFTQNAFGVQVISTQHGPVSHGTTINYCTTDPDDNLAGDNPSTDKDFGNIATPDGVPLSAINNVPGGTSTAVISPSTLGPGSYQFYYNNASQIFYVEITVAPVLTSSPTGTICSGVAQNYTITTDAGGNMDWSRAAVVGISEGPNTGINLINETLTNTTTSPINVVYDITPQVGCPNNLTYTVTVNPAPDVTSAATGSVCSGLAHTYTITSDIGGTTYSWSRAAVAGITEGANTGTSAIISETLTNTTLLPIDVDYVIIPTAGGCDGPTFTYTLTVNPNPTVSISGLDYIDPNPAPWYCDSDYPLGDALTGTPAGGVFSGSGINDLGGGNAEFFPSTAGLGLIDITYTYTDGNGCTSPVTETTRVGTQVYINGLTSQLCENDAPDDYSYTPFDGTSVILLNTVDITPGIIDGSASFDPANVNIVFGANTLTYQYTDASACVNEVSQNVDVYEEPVANFSGLNASYCTNAADVTLTGSHAPGGTFSGDGITDNGDGTATFSPSSLVAGGAYSVTYTYTTGLSCTDTETKNVTINQAPSATISGDATTCAGDATPISINFTATGPYDFDFTYTNGITPVTVSNYGSNNYTTNVNPISTSTYLVTVITDNNNGCSSAGTGSAVKTVNAVPTADAGFDQTMCLGAGETLTASATGGTGAGTYSYNWSSGAITASTTVNPTPAGGYTYTVTVTDGNSCTDTDDVIVTAVNNPTVDAGANQFSCNGEDVTLTATLTGATTGPYTYSWGAAGAGNPITVNPTNAVAGAAPIDYAYTVTVTDANTCTATDNTNVRVNAPSNIIIANDGMHYCKDPGAVALSATPAGGTWIDDGGLTLVANAFDPSAEISQPYTIEYEYDDPATGGCTTTKQATLEVLQYSTPANLTITTPNSGLFCETDAGPYTISAEEDQDLTGQAGVVETITSSGAGLTDNGNGTASLDPSVAGAGVYTITYDITTPGCSNSTTKNITVGTEITYNNPVQMCVGDANIPLVASNVNGEWTITFVDDATFTTNVYGPYTHGDPNAVLQATEAGTYTIDYELTNPGEYNCAASATTIVYDLPAVSFTIDGNPHTDLDINFCDNGSLVTLVGNWPTNNIFSGAGVSANKFDPTTGAGPYTITYTHTDANGCINSVSSEIVTVNDAPTVTIDGLTSAFCNDDAAITITGNPTAAAPVGNFSWPGTWTDGTQYTDNLDGTAELDPSAVVITGGYNISYSVTDANNCTGTITETIDINPLPTVDFAGLPAAICKNASAVTLTGSPTNANGTFSGDGITNNGDGTASFNPNALSTGNHTITYTYTNPLTLCDNSKSYTVDVLALPNKFTVTAPTGLEYCETDAGITIGVSNSQAGNDYDLIRDGITTVASQASAGGTFNFGVDSYSAGNYTVIAKNADGCEVTFDNTVTSVEVASIAGAGAISGSTSICADGVTTYTYSVPLITNATDHVWILPAGVTLDADTDNSIDVIFDPTYVSGSDIEVYGNDVTSVCPAGNSSFLTITSNPIPTDLGGSITSSTGAFNVCAEQTGVVFSVDPTDFSNETEFEWQISGGTAVFASATTAANVTVDFTGSSGTVTIRVRAKNSCGTTAWITQAITVDPIPNVSINALGAGDVINCAAGSQVQLNAASTEAPGDITGWSWSSSNGGVIVAGDETVQDPFVTKEADYTVQIEVTKNLACYNTATITVGADKTPPTVTIDPAEDLTCTNGSLVTLQANAVNVSYDWSFTPPANITTATNISNPSVDQPGTYTVTVTDLSNSCTASASVTIADDTALPDVSVTTPAADEITCTNTTVVLNGGSSTTNKTFSWVGPGGATITNTTDEDPTVDMAGVYTLTVTNTDNGCTDSKTVTVIDGVDFPVAVISNVDVEYNELTCTNTEVDLQASVAGVPTATFVWSTGGGNFVSQSGVYNQYATVDVAATYSVVATNPTNGCTSVIESEVVDEDLSTATTTTITSAGTELTCTNGGTLNLVANITGDPGTGTFSWSGTGVLIPPLNINNVNVTSAGTYTLTYTHSVTGCQSSANIVVTNETAAPTVSIDAGPYIVTCADISATSAITPTLTATGDADPLTTYLWTGPGGAVYSDNTALSTTVDVSGTYTITATNQYGCTATDNVTVTSNKTPPTITVIDPEPDKITCASSTVTLSGSTSTGTATLLWTGPVGATITNAATTSPSVNMAGTYTLTVTDANNGCIATDDVTVSDNYASPNITVTDPAADELTCDATQIQLSTSTPVAGVTYAWTGPVGATITNVNSSDPWVNMTGTYTVIATHPTSGCTQTETIDVNDDYQQPVVNIVPEAFVITCTQSTINLDASTSTNATTFAWSTPDGNIVSGGATNTAEISTAGTYNLLVTYGATGCTETGQVIITESLATPNVNVTGGLYTITCTDPTPELAATVDVGSSVAWTGPGTIWNSTTLNPTVDAAGTYIITATAANGCTATDNVLVTNDNANPDITVDTNTDDITCDNTLVTVSGSSITPGVTYLWQVLSGGGNITSATSATTTVDAAGDYRLTITDSNGCTNTDVVTVGSNKVDPNIGIVDPDDDEITCAQSTVALNGSSTTLNAQFSWSTLVADATIVNGNSPTPTVNKTGDYTLTVTNPVNGCTSTATTTVNGNFATPTINIAAVGSQITCTNTTIILDATASTNATNYSWAASLGGHILTNGSTATPTIDAAGRYTVTAEHTTTGCIASDFVDVTQDASVPVIDVFDPFPGDITCTDATVTLSADATGLGVNKDITWSTSDGNYTSGTINITNPTVDQGGTYVVTITNTTNSCSTVRSVTIDENTTAPAISIDVPLDFTCSRTQVNLKGTGTSVDLSPVTYAWVAGAGGNIVSGAATSTAVVNAVADYTVTVTDLGNGCTNSSTVSTTEDITPPDVSVDVTPDQITCDAATIILNGSSTYPNVSYNWTTTGSGTIQNASTTTPIVNAVGTYNLTVTNTDNNCTATSANVIVTEDKVTPTVTVNAPSGDLTCNITEVTISVSEDVDYSYSWSGPGTIVTPNSHSTNVDATGTYTVIIEDIANGCTNSYTVDVSDDKIPSSSPVINDIETCYGTANPGFNVISGTNVQWYDAAANFLASGNSYTPTVTTAGTHTFYATSTGANGCESLPTEVVLTINALPDAPVTIGNAICEGSAAEELTGVGSNINWYDDTNAFLASGSTYVPGDNIVGSYTYYATQTDANNCESAQTSATYTINAIPAQPVFTNPNMEICETETNPTYTVVGSNVKWYKTIGGAAISTGNTYQPADVIPAIYTYYATQTVSSCESPEATGTFTINAMPEVYNVQDGGSYCEGTGGTDITLSNSEIGVNYELWLNETTMIIDVAGTGAPINFGNQTLEGNYTVYGYNAASLCRIKMNGSVDVSIDPLPDAAPTITGSDEVCQNETDVSYSVPAIANATNYEWTVPAGFNIVSGSNSNSITVNIDNTAASGNISVYAENACGVGTTSPVFFVTVNPIPGPALNLTGPNVICNDEDGVTFTVDADSDATQYNWTLPQGASIIAGANSRQITLNFDQTAVNDVIIVAAANACGEGTSASQLITVNDLPYVSAGNQQDLCVDNTILDANIPVSGTGTWTVYGGAVTLSDVNDPTATATNIGEGNNRLVWTIVDGNGCSLSDTVLITNNTVIVEAGNNQVVCEESITLDGSVVPIGAVGSWSATTGTANFTDGNSPTAVASGFTSGINILKWTVTKGGCTNYDTLVVDNQRPSEAYAGIDLSICGDSTQLNANNPAIGTGLWSVVIGAATFEDDNLNNTKVSGLSKGENTLRWTISNGICSTFDELTITNNKIQVEAGVDQIICDNTTSLDATEFASGTGYWAINSGSASFVAFEEPNTIVTGLKKGANVLTWNINNNSCISSDSVTITNDSPTDSYAGKDTTVTSGLITLQGNIPVIGTGVWSLISGSGIIDDILLNNTTVSSLGISENTFRWTVTHNSCISTDDVIITNANAQPPNAGTDQTLCSSATTLEGNDPVFGYGEWSVVQGSATFKDVNDPITSVTGLAKGDNILRWSIWENGWSSDDVIITNDSPSDANAGLDKILCADSTNLAGNNPIIGSGLWTVVSGAGTFGNDSLYNTKVTNLAKGENIFKWTISNRACSDDDIVIIRNDLPTVAEAGDDATICESTITLNPNTPSVGTGYWSIAQGSAYFEDNTAKNIARGDNIFIWTIENNACSYSDSVLITNYEPSDANAGADKILCVDTITLAANTVVYGTGVWTQETGSSTFNPTTATTSVTNLSEGLNVFKWTITYNSCIKSDRVTINNASVVATAGVDQELCDESTYLEANNPSSGLGTWSVLGGSGSANFTSINENDTWVTDLDKGNNVLRWTVVNEICSDFDDVLIKNNVPTSAFAGPDQALCTDNSILQANTPIYGTGEWSIISGSADISSLNDPSSIVSNLDYGVNTLVWTITNGGCTSADQIIVSNNSTIQSNAGYDQELCKDSTVLFANVPAYGTGTWSVVAGSATFENNNYFSTKVTNVGKGDNILKWTIVNGECSSTDEVTITNNYPIKAIAGADQTLCGNTTYLQGNNPQSYTGTWSLVSGAATFTNSTQNNTEVTGLNPGSNTLRWIISNGGCSSTDDVIIYNDLPYTAEAGEDFEICGSTTPLYANDPISGVGQWTVVSGTATFSDATRYDATVSALGFGANTLRWTITYDQCTTVDEIIVKNNKIQVYAGVDQVVTEPTTLLAASNPSTGIGSWSVQGGAGSFTDSGNSITEVTGLGSGLNTFRWSVDINNCTSFDDVSITYNELPVSSMVITQSEGCPPLDVYFINNSLDGLPFTWDFDDGTSSDLVTVKHTYNDPGIYKPSLTIVGNNGELVVKDTTITVYDQPNASFLIVNKQVYIPEEEAIFINTSTDAITYEWEFGDGGTSTESDPKYVYDTEGIYNVILHAWSDKDCYDSVKVAGGVEVYESTVVVFPTAFTPNLDGSSGGVYNQNDFSNDVFYPIGDEIMNYHLEVFNRWGVLIFESMDMSIGWDGYYDNKLLDEGVYVWKVTGKYNNGKDFNKVGTIMLLH